MKPFIRVCVFRLSSGYRVGGILRGPAIEPVGPMYDTESEARTAAADVPRKHEGIGFYDFTKDQQ